MRIFDSPMNDNDENVCLTIERTIAIINKLATAVFDEVVEQAKNAENYSIDFSVQINKLNMLSENIGECFEIKSIESEHQTAHQKHCSTRSGLIDACNQK